MHSGISILLIVGLGTAAKRNVGTGANQIPDMSAFGVSGAGWAKLPTGMIIQWGAIAAGSGDVTTSFAIPFPSFAGCVLCSSSYTAGSGAIAYFAGVDISKSQMVSRASSPSIGGRYIAIGM